MRDVTEMLSAWNSFYVLIGSASAALTGLMFVVITLVSDSERAASQDGIATFSTPTVVHFCYPLFIAALMSAPFRTLVPIAIILGLAGAGGLIYVTRITRRTSRLQTYEPDAEDWAFNVLLPFIAYAAIVGGALAMHAAPAEALFAPAGAATLLVFVGIHNAWDVVTYLAMGKAAALPDQPPNE